MSTLMDLNEETFGKEVSEDNNDVVVVNFWADWCGPCKLVTPIMEELSNETKTKICKVNVDECPTLADRCGVKSVPTLLIFRNGRKIDQICGIKTKDELEKLIFRY